jgi:hypothetical protein
MEYRGSGPHCRVEVNGVVNCQTTRICVLSPVKTRSGPLRKASGGKGVGSGAGIDGAGVKVGRLVGVAVGAACSVSVKVGEASGEAVDIRVGLGVTGAVALGAGRHPASARLPASKQTNPIPKRFPISKLIRVDGSDARRASPAHGPGWRRYYRRATAGMISRPKVSSGLISSTLGMLKIAC